ncbi:hypothetical protein M501DRAFT_934981 [Patellaria atrata CBS 101060]|uniref:Protein kinase domain-containing protein n=1 Tax=Patellaria atrata CBS 101060 TaxID=1346257 RepID=A0A9P4SBP9_9PEZI|nr:hypothetical protein M501DRAFT_934981 [Patellaria atrata CBS 101060]
MSSTQPGYRQPSELLEPFSEQTDTSIERSYDDVDVQQIATLLQHINLAWSRVPRTYIVLRKINRLDTLADLIAFGFTDYSIPITPRSLPRPLDITLRGEFERAQPCVLTQLFNLERGVHGSHVHFPPDAAIPLLHQGTLGTGGYGVVDKVQSLISYKTYARKQVPRKFIIAPKGKKALQLLENETEVIKGLNHHHIVSFIDSYTDSDFFALIMSPVGRWI